MLEIGNALDPHRCLTKQTKKSHHVENNFKAIRSKMIQKYHTLEFARSNKDIKFWSTIKSLVNEKILDTKSNR